jgi:hypothetical protein
MIAICLLADCIIFGFAAAWTGDVLEAGQVFLVVGGPLTVLVGWRAYLLLQADR